MLFMFNDGIPVRTPLARIPEINPDIILTVSGVALLNMKIV